MQRENEAWLRGPGRLLGVPVRWKPPFSLWVLPATRPDGCRLAEGCRLYTLHLWGVSLRPLYQASVPQPPERDRNGGRPWWGEGEGPPLPTHQGSLQLPLKADIYVCTGLVGTGRARHGRTGSAGPTSVGNMAATASAPRAPRGGAPARVRTAAPRPLAAPPRSRTGLWGGRASPRADWWRLGPAFC